MRREERERMLRMVTWLTQLEWQMDWPLLMEWRRMKAEWYREMPRREKSSKLPTFRASQAQPMAAGSGPAVLSVEC